MHTLIVRGDEKDAFAACDARGIEITSMVKHPKFRGCIVTAAAITPWATLARWFCEPGDAPFPDGALLWYGPVFEPAPPEVWNKVEVWS